MVKWEFCHIMNIDVQAVASKDVSAIKFE